MQFRGFLSLLAVLASGVFLNAQEVAPASEDRGVLTGVVVDAELGFGVRGTTVLISGTGLQTTTDLEGRYVIRDIPPGTYDVLFSKGGYQRARATDVVIAGGESKKIDFPLRLAVDDIGGSVIEMQELVITAEVLENSEIALLGERQRSATISDAISSESFSRLGVGDAAEALSKVTGASVVDGKYVLIRGLGDRYTNTTLNNTTVPTADPDRRAVQMDQFPSDLLESIVTSKSFTPDQPGAFSGGNVDVRTKSFPDRFFATLSGSIGYNTNATRQEILKVPGSDTDWLGFDDGTRDLPEIPDGYSQITRQGAVSRAFRGDTEQAMILDMVTSRFDNRTYFPYAADGSIDRGFAFAIGDQLNWGEEQAFGYTVSLTWDYGVSHYDDGITGRYSGSADFAEPQLIYSPDPQDFVVDLREAVLANPDTMATLPPLGVTNSEQAASLGLFSKLAYRPTVNHEINLNLFLNQSNEDAVRRGVGNDIGSSSAELFEVYDMLYTERSVGSYQLQGESVFPNLNETVVNWRASIGRSTQKQPDYRSGSVFTNLDSGSLAVAAGVGFNRFWRDVTEDNTEFGIDVAIPFDLLTDNRSEFKFGAVATDSERRYREWRFTMQPNPSTATGRPDLESFPGDNLTLLDENGELKDIFLPVTDPNGVGRVAEGGRSLNNYDGEQSIRGLYAMFDLPLTSRLRTIFGVRSESTEISTDNPPDGSDIPSALLPGSIDQTDILPALHFVYSLTENTNLRFAYGRTIARPTYKELAEVIITDVFTQEDYSGNSELELTQVDNFDVRWEWFTEDGGIIAISAFYKDMEKPIEVLLRPRDGFIQPQNVEEGEVYGVEFEFRRDLSSFGDWLTGFSFGSNLSIIESEVSIPQRERDEDPLVGDVRQLLGQSPYIFNADLTYEEPDWGSTFSIVYNIVGERLTVVTNGSLEDVFEQPSPQLDFIYSQALTDQMRLKFSAKNLLDSDREKTIDFQDEDLIYERYSRGRSFSLSLTYSFN